MSTDSEAASALREDIVTFNRRLRSYRGEHHLTPSQMQVLAHLDRVGPMSAAALAALEHLTPQSIARTVAALDADGLVLRTSDPDDARASSIALTERGLAMLTEDRGRRTEWLEHALASELTDAERDIVFVAGRLLRKLAESGR